MAYRVELSPQAEQEIEQAYLWILNQSPASAHRWYNGLIDALNSLKTMPQRRPLAPEHDAFDDEIRQLLYGRRQHRYRALFTVHGRTIRVLHVRHGAMRHLSPGAMEADDE